MTCSGLGLYYRYTVFTFTPLSPSIIENGAEKCSDLIEAHLKCMRDLGFKI